MKHKEALLNLKVKPLFLLWCVIAVLLFGSIASANESQIYIDKAKQLNLASDPFWISLLHFKGQRSQILDQDFFLSPHGSTDPQAEMDATIDVYFTNKHSIKREWGDNQIRCIFPARYMWLNAKLNLPDFRLDADICPGLSHWARIDQIEAVSILYVSGYLGNPASSFGHVLLNFKLNNNEFLFGLFDTSISYGATVPIHENMILYALKGLLGGYSASFSDKFFYAHDQVYSSREFRDMWEYTLNLTDFQKKMLIYHIAELLTKRYKYYFLSANCAHRMAVLLDIIIPEAVYPHDYPIYVPEELFHSLKLIDQQRRAKGENGLISNVHYIPSARRYLYYETANLNRRERQVYTKITGHPLDNLDLQLKELDVEGQIHVLNALLAYQYYKLLSSEEEQVDGQVKAYKDKILLQRLRLPARKQVPIVIPDVPSPREVSPPSSFNLGINFDKDHHPFSTVGVTIFRKESVGRNALEYNELIALDLQAGLYDDSDQIFLDSFNLLRIQDFRTFYIKEANENPFSWRLDLGTKRIVHHDDFDYDHAAEGAVGLVKKIEPVGIYYGFINAGLHTKDQQYRAGPSIGTILGKGRLKFSAEYGLSFGLEDLGYVEKIDGKLQYQFNNENAIQLRYQKEDQDRLSLNYLYYW